MTKKYIDYFDTQQGRWASKYDDIAWQVDGGANDEGFTFRWCSWCRRDTEHEIDDCIECYERSKQSSQPILRREL